MKLQGKTAVITGAASGMGRAIVVLFAQEGAKVMAVDLNLEGVQETVELIARDGAQLLPS